MAEIHWHLRRLILAETAARAERRRDRLVQDDEKDARQEAGKLHELEPYVAGKLGLVWLHDSPVKFEQVIGFLQQIDEEVQQEGFQDEGPAFLKCLYGHQPGNRGLKLITAYEICLKEQHAALELSDKASSQETENAGTGGSQPARAGDSELARAGAADTLEDRPPGFYRAEFHKLIAGEIAWFKEHEARYLLARAELKVARTEAALELDQRSRMSLLNQERLERLFERKWKFLNRYRRGGSAGTRRLAASGML